MNPPAIAAFAVFFLAFAMLAAEPSQTGSPLASANFQPKIRADHQAGLRQEPVGSTTSVLVTTNQDHHIVLCMSNHTSGSTWLEYGRPVPIALPYTFTDTNSGLCFRVEKDGRHISATSADGTERWRRDPFADAHLEFYRTATPQIVHVSSSYKSLGRLRENKRVIALNYNSTQFGELDVETGDFFFIGQD